MSRLLMSRLLMLRLFLLRFTYVEISPCEGCGFVVMEKVVASGFGEITYVKIPPGKGCGSGVWGDHLRKDSPGKGLRIRGWAR